VSDAESESLADLRNTLRDVEKAAENARKDAVEEELSNRVESGSKDRRVVVHRDGKVVRAGRVNIRSRDDA